MEKPCLDKKFEVYSDGHSDYPIVIQEHFNIDCVDYGQLIKIKKGGRVIDKKKTIIFGNPKIENIETTVVECFNSILRERLSRLVRKTRGYSRDKNKLTNAIELFQFYWNFMKTLHGKLTPGMEEGLTSKIWMWGNFLHTRLSDIN